MLDEMIVKFTTPPVTMYGDVDLDGEVKTVDSSNILNYLAGNEVLTEQALANADVNLDGNVDTDDSDIIKAYVTHFITELPYTGPILQEWFN